MNMSKMQKSRAIMLLKQPFFASLLMSTKAVETTEVETAATDMTHLYYNPEFIDSLEPEVVLFVLAHEVMHIALAHGMRLMSRNQRIWNYACDYAINMMLKDTGFTIWDKCLHDEKYRGMSADQIYELLMQQMEKERKAGGSGDIADSHGDAGGMGNDVQAPAEALDPASASKVRRSIQQRVAQAATAARMAGKFGGELERMVGEILEPKVPWSMVLRDMMTRVTKDDEQWSRRNRRFTKVYLPARHSEKMGEIVLIGDTSGSIGNDELCKYMAEAGGIAEDVRPERIRILWCDTKVAGEQVFEDGEPIVAKPMGGGGTDMRVALKHAEQYEPECVVLFTDGYTPWPDVEPDYPLIVCCTTGTDVPVGMDIRI